MVEHVAGRADNVALGVGDDVQPLVELRLGVAVSPPDAGIAAVALNPEQRRRDPLVELEPVVDLGVERAGALVVGVGEEGALVAVAGRSRPLAGEPGGAVGAQQRIGLDEPIGDRLDVRVLEGGVDLVQPQRFAVVVKDTPGGRPCASSGRPGGCRWH